MDAQLPIIAECIVPAKAPPFAEWRREARALIVLGWPVVGAQLAQISMHTVDAVMAGRLSPQDLASIAVGGSLWLPVCIFGMGILMAISPMVAHDFGSGNDRAAGRHLRQGLWLSQAIALVAFLIIRQTPRALGLLEVDEAIIPTAAGYLRAVSWGLPATFAFTVLRSFSEAVAMTRPVLFVSLFGLVANIVGNYVLMYGHLGLPRMGAIGCGVATAITLWMMGGALALWIVMHSYFHRFAPFAQFEWPRRSDLQVLLQLGIPIGFSLFMEGSLFAAVALLLGRFGADVVSGHQIALNVASITFMVPLGLTIAVTVRVGHALGRQSPRDARRAGTMGAVLAVSFMAVAALVMAGCAPQIAAIYSPDPHVQSIAVRLLYMAAIFQVFDGLQVAGAGALRGLKDTAVPVIITFVAYWGLGLPLGYALGILRNGGPQAMWVGLIVGLTVAAVLLNCRFQVQIYRRMALAPQEAVRRPSH